MALWQELRLWIGGVHGRDLDNRGWTLGRESTWICRMVRTYVAMLIALWASGSLPPKFCLASATQRSRNLVVSQRAAPSIGPLALGSTGFHWLGGGFRKLQRDPHTIRPPGDPLTGSEDPLWTEALGQVEGDARRAVVVHDFGSRGTS